MDISSWFTKLEQTQTSYLLLAALTVTVLAAGTLFQIGLIGWVLRGLGMIVRGGIRSGFLLWERLLAWASWPLFLGMVFGYLLVGGMAGGPLPAFLPVRAGGQSGSLPLHSQGGRAVRTGVLSRRLLFFVV
jgi:hypothetical protein